MLKHFNLNIALLIIFSLISTIKSEAKINKTQDSSYITKLLEETEDLKTKNYQKFSDNLKELKKNSISFTPFQKCFFDFLISYELIFTGKYKIAIENLSKLSNECKHVNVNTRINAILSNHYIIARDYFKSITHLNNVIAHIDDIEDKKTKHIAYLIATIVYNMINQNELSLKFSELLINDQPSQSNLCKAKSNKYNVILNANYDGSLDDQIIETISNCNNVGEVVYSYILNIYWLKYRLNASNDNQNIIDILNIITQLDQQIEDTKYKHVIAIKNGLLAEVYWKLGDFEKSIYYAELSLDGDAAIGNTTQKIESLTILIMYYKKINNKQKAFEYLEKKSKAEKIHFDDKQAKVMAFQTVQHDNLAKTHQINYLNKQNEVLKLSNDLAEQAKLNQQLIILSLVLASAFLLFWGYRHRREQKIYRKLSELDHMTLIYNRKGLRDYMDYLLPYSEKKQETIAYGIFDLDHFKRVNDQYGHITGDWVIKNVILACQKIRNDNEKITFGRLGGEEFAIIIRDSNIDELQEFAEKCRASIEAINTKDSGYDFQITASFGITTTQKSSFIYTDLMTNADKALYQAKDQGRNQVVVFKT
jgi:diguanylate cyclase (GGDEF)-like protein